MFPVPPFSPGTLLIRRREALGYRRQGDLSAASTAIAAQFGKDEVASLSQAALSRLESGQITEARVRTLRLLALALRLNAREFESHIGVPCPAVPFLDGRRDEAGLTIAALRLDAQLSVKEVRDAMAAVGGAVDLPVYLAIEAGVIPLERQHGKVQVALQYALGIQPADWKDLVGLQSVDSGQVTPSGLRILDWSVARCLALIANGAVPSPRRKTLPLYPTGQLYPPTLPGADNMPEQVTVPDELIQPGVLLTAMPDDALWPWERPQSAADGVAAVPGPFRLREGHRLLVDTLVRDVQAGRVYVVQAGDSPLMVRRAGLDAVGQLWLLPDVPDFQRYLPVLALEARVVGEVTYAQRGQDADVSAHPESEDAESRLKQDHVWEAVVPHTHSL